MSARVEDFDQYVRFRLDLRIARRKAASWRNPAWQYKSAATHSDSAAFRERQIARGMRLNRKGVNHE